MKRAMAVVGLPFSSREVSLCVHVPEDISRRAEWVDDAGEVLGAPLLSQYVLAQRASGGVTVVRLTVEEYEDAEMLPPGFKRHLAPVPVATARKRKPRGKK